MKKIVCSLALLSLLVALTSGCVSNTKATTAAGDPVISGLEMPKEVAAGGSFPVEFAYTGTGELSHLIVTFYWPGGQESHKLTQFGIKDGRCQIKLQVGPKTGNLEIQIQAVDMQGRTSNKISKTINRL